MFIIYEVGVTVLRRKASLRIIKLDIKYWVNRKGQENSIKLPYTVLGINSFDC